MKPKVIQNSDFQTLLFRQIVWGCSKHADFGKVGLRGAHDSELLTDFQVTLLLLAIGPDSDS